MSQLITIKLSKSPGQPWGFRLQGGKDFAQPLCIQKVNPGSVAAAAGVASGDAIVSIGGRDALAMRHKEAQDAIVSAGETFDMLVQRGSMTWKPKVTPLEQPKATPEGPVATQTSLAAAGKKPTKAPKGFNAAPQGFGQVNGTPLTTPQYNSPINLYNEEAIAEALSSQAEVLGNQGKGCLGINFRKFDREVKLRTDSPTYMLLHGEEPPAAPKPRKQLPPPAEPPVQEKPVFPAAQPGQQPGYYNVNDKMYCDIHAKQAAKHNPPAPNMVPVTVKPGAAPPPGAVPAPVSLACNTLPRPFKLR